MRVRSRPAHGRYRFDRNVPSFAVVAVLAFMAGCGRYRFEQKDGGASDLDGGPTSDAGRTEDSGPGPDSGGCGGPCDTGDPCTLGTLDCAGTPTCVVMGAAANSVVCRAAATPCDAVEFCQAGVCPPDGLAISACPDTVLAACGSVCDGTSADCTACPSYLQFDGNDRVTLPNEPLASVAVGQPASVAVFVWVDAGVPADTFLSVYLSRSASNTNVATGLLFNTNPLSNYHPCFLQQRSSGMVTTECSVSSGDASGVTGRWHHFAAVTDGSSIMTYVDGVPSSGDNDLMVVGANSRAVGSTLVGRLRNLSLWRVELSPQKVGELARGAAISVSDPDLLEWWPMDEGMGTTIRSRVTDVTGQFGSNATSEPTIEPTWGP